MTGFWRTVLLRAVPALALGVMLFALVGTAAPTAEASPARERVRLLKVMPLGDSITYGVGSGKLDGYRTALYWRLAAGVYKIRKDGRTVTRTRRVSRWITAG